MKSELQTLLVAQYVICGDDESCEVLDGPLDFQAACVRLEQLREQNPFVDYSLMAEIEA
jgi:hypothetical protein